MNNSSRVAYNTIVIYVQLILSTFIGLFTVRFVLQALGNDDYGIYMLVAGVVAMLNFLSSSMTNASMRYMSYSMGKEDVEESKRTFNNALYIHLLLGLAIVVVLELGGWAMFKWMLDIPVDRLFAAQVVFQFMILSTFIAIISVPYDAVITSHENLLALSLVKLLGHTLNLVVAIYLLRFGGDRLIWYGALTVGVNIIERLIKQIYCTRKYPECGVRIKQYKDKGLIKSMLSFTGWEMLASVAAMCSGQLRGIFINMFFGVSLNAGEGIAKRVNGQVNQVSVGITQSLTPQMNKSEGGGDRERLIRLTNVGVKFTTFMFALLAIPIAVEASFLLGIWLGDVPPFAVVFCQLTMIIQLLNKMTWQISNAIRSVGKIKVPRIVNGLLAVISMAVAYVVFKMGGGATSIYYVQIVFTLIDGAFLLYFGKTIVGINPWDFIKKTTIPVIIPLIISLTAAVLIILNMPQGWLRFILDFSIFVILFSALFYFFSITKEEKEILRVFVLSFINKLIFHRKNDVS